MKPRAAVVVPAAVVVLAGGVLTAGCSRQTEPRPSMPEDRKVLMDTMPAGIPEDSMAAQMRRAFEGDTASRLK